jgi:subtilase family serine protease
LPNYLKPLELAVLEAVHKRGITVCFSAGNGHMGFPAQMPSVIAVGGVYAHENLAGDLEAVHKRGITVCFSAGNGHMGFPAQMPSVIAVGGVYAHENLAGDDFKLEASDYASSQGATYPTSVG